MSNPKILFLHLGPTDSLSSTIISKIQQRGLSYKINPIHVQDSKTRDLLKNNSKGVKVTELPCFVVLEKAFTFVYPHTYIDNL